MKPNPVREALHKLKDRLSGLCMRLEAREINAFALERSEERLGDGVIPAVSFPAHTHRDAHFRKQRLIRMAGVLASAIIRIELTKKYLCIQLSNVDKPTFRYAGSAGDAALDVGG
jgi:hypothetical protein